MKKAHRYLAWVAVWVGLWVLGLIALLGLFRVAWALLRSF